MTVKVLPKKFAKSSEEEVAALKAKPISMSKNMQRSQTWALNVLTKWLNGGKLNMEVDFLLKIIEKEKVCGVLCKYIVEQNSAQGNCIALRLLQLLVNLQSYASDHN